MMSKSPLQSGVDALGKQIWEERVCEEKRTCPWGQRGRDLLLMD